jgi:basic membrane protein A
MKLSVYEATMSSANDEFDAEAYVGTLENEGVGIAELHNFEDKVDPELWTAVQDLQQQIIDGEVTVTSYLG